MDIILGLIFIVVLLALSFLLAMLIWGFFYRNESHEIPGNGFIVLWVLCLLFLAWLYDLITYTPLGG
jgi:hypothetical protein